LIEELFDVMYNTGADFTNSFRKLSELKLNGKDMIENDIDEYIKTILKQCSSVTEMKAFHKPKFPKE